MDAGPLNLAGRSRESPARYTMCLLQDPQMGARLDSKPLRKPERDPAVASLRRCLRFEPEGDGGCSEQSPRRWSQAWPRCW